MPDLRIVTYVLGLLLLLLGGTMLVPAAVDAVNGSANWTVFLGSSALTLLVGGLLALGFRGSSTAIDRRQAFILVTAAWVVLPLFAAVPLVRADIALSFTDAFFEAMSGLTTTGSTVITGLDHLPRGILLWRAMLQWLGGVGIILMAMALLPLLQVGGMQLFRLESSDASEKTLPRTAAFAGWIGGIYTGLSLICFGLLWWAGMPAFDAAAHTMSTIATAGFSTKDASVGHFDSATIEAIIVCFMVVGGLPFTLYLLALKAGPRVFWRDAQARAFIAVVITIIAATTLWLHLSRDYSLFDALRYGSFNMISMLTGTGFASMDYGQWGGFALTAILFVMLIGGCAGSTTCGVKIFRWQVIVSALTAWTRRLLHPHGLFTPQFQNKPISASITESVMAYFFLLMASLSVMSVALAAVGLDYLTAVSGAVTSLSNVGPGLGATIGPTGTFADLPDAAKWLLSFAMLLGRLDLFTVLVLFTPAFWRG
ncbi:potassium transporter TrkH [Rhodothalassium salexigens]|uniref:potassium transporter TrkG n=1 Tax=Rhodothalassium salexigens TaxID=1086 RepID=UPI001912A02B|nr:potassium transporter TrkH [Rhodothalassium salexigens]